MGHLHEFLDAQRRASLASTSALACGLRNDRHADAPGDAVEAKDADHEHAEQIVLNDMESFTDFISCLGKRHVDSDRIIRVPQLAEFRVRDADLCQVVHLLLTGDHNDVVLARDELKRRYMADNAKHIAEMAARFAGQRGEA